MLTLRDGHRPTILLEKNTVPDKVSTAAWRFLKKRHDEILEPLNVFALKKDDDQVAEDWTRETLEDVANLPHGRVENVDVKGHLDVLLLLLLIFDELADEKLCGKPQNSVVLAHVAKRTHPCTTLLHQESQRRQHKLPEVVAESRADRLEDDGTFVRLP